MSSFYHSQMANPWRVSALVELVRDARDRGLTTIPCDDPIAIGAGRPARCAFRQTEVTALHARLAAENVTFHVVDTPVPAADEAPIVDAFGRPTTGYTIVLDVA